ncbi:hypothetical protein IV203_021751 [Nitzschia inconspicua]|uniref:Uncharacterized protein n=1 Tax=Nitzschia inconspicua TaxID=303405 RepID=A0A9K3KJ20_9STRA|nr:hypothetical protein IV203_021751 [Nitzschia inconspicua]
MMALLLLLPPSSSPTRSLLQQPALLLSTLSGFDADITSITIDCGTEFLTGNIGRQKYPDPAMVDVTLPLACFADASSASREVTVGVTWWVNNDSVPRLRGLQNNDDLPDNGSFEYALDVEIVPMEDGRSASVTRLPVLVWPLPFSFRYRDPDPNQEKRVTWKEDKLKPTTYIN